MNDRSELIPKKKSGLARRTEISCGGVVWHKQGRAVHILLITRKDRSVWCLPKGKVEKGESREQTALREVAEETGLFAEITDDLGKIFYTFTDTVRHRYVEKTVYFFLMQPRGGSEIGVHDHPYELVRWMPASQAMRALAYPGERAILSKALSLVRQSHKNDTVD